MATAAQIRTQIQAKIFAQYGKSVVLSSAGSHTYDERGQITSYVATTSNITVVPYDVTKDRLLFERFGDFNAGEASFAVPYSVTIAVGDRIAMNGDSYEVQMVAPQLLPDTLVTIIKVAKIVA